MYGRSHSRLEGEKYNMPRPLRSSLEKVTKDVPNGPLGFIGGGNAVGAVMFALSEVAGFFTPGSSLDPGYKIQSHSIDQRGDVEVHTFRVSSYFEQTARFASKFNTAPSNADFFIRDIDVTRVGKVEDRSTVATWEITVEISEDTHIEA